MKCKWLQKIVYDIELIAIQRILWKSCREDDHRFDIEPLQHLQAGDFRHLGIQENKVGFVDSQKLFGLHCTFELSLQLQVGDLLRKLLQDFASHRFVVNYDATQFFHRE